MRHSKLSLFIGATALLGVGFAASRLALRAQENGTARKAAPVARTSEVVLFSGNAADVAANWVRRGSTEPGNWKVRDGSLVAGGGDIVTRQKFKDFQLHIEFRLPEYPPNVRGQARANSGIFLQSRYEIQVLDSYGSAEPGTGDAGAVYNQAAPLVHAYKPPKEWQTYDIAFRAPRVDAAGKMTEKARVTILLNGFVIQNNHEIAGLTGDPMDQNVGEPGPIRIQDHGNPIEFRNIRVMALPEQGASHY